MVDRNWHRQDIIAAVRKTGTTLARLAEQHGYARNTLYLSLDRRFPNVHAVIAAKIGSSRGAIWPSWYHPDGEPRFVTRRNARRGG